MAKKTGNRIGSMTYTQLKLTCIARGMPFEEVVNGDHSRLSVWLHNNYQNKPLYENIVDFEEKLDNVLEFRGYAPDDPVRKNRLTSTLDSLGIRVSKRKKKVKGVIKKEKAPARVKDPKLKIVQGTKKHFVMSLAANTKLTVDQIIEKTLKEYPDANEASIKVWVGRSRKR